MGKLRVTQTGALDKRISLQSPTLVADDMGGSTVTWATSYTVAAAVWPASASEQVKAGAPVMSITHRIRIRYRSGVLASWRILYNTRYFSIVSVTSPNEAREWIDLLCREVAA